MKLVAIIENVNQPRNKNLVNQIIIIDAKLKGDIKNELCYFEPAEEEYYFRNDRKLMQLLGLKHSVSNIEIIGVL